MLPWQPFVFSVSHHFWDEKQGNLTYFQDNYLIRIKFGTEGYFQTLNSNSSKIFMYDVILTSQ